MQHPTITKAVTWFFEELSKHNVRYAILRKAERVPDDIGNDIDILISDEDVSFVTGIIGDCANIFGFRVYTRKDVRGLYQILYAFFEGKLVFVRFDFTNPVKDPDELLGKRLQNDKRIFYLPAGLYEKKKRSNLKNILTFPWRFIFPSGRFTVIVGPDGVGKSTTAEFTKQILEAFHIPVLHSHLGFRPRILPTRKNAMSLGKEEPLRGEKSKIPGILRFFYHALDYILGYLLVIRPLLVKKRIVIGERYYYNYLVDPRPRKELGFPGWLPRFVYSLFITKPDIFILLSNNPEEIQKRRQEHSVEEISRQLEEYRKIGKKTRKFFEIKTNKPASEVAMEVAEKLISENN